MEQITLPNRPTNLSPKVEVLEFAHEGIKARVILSLDDSLNNGHLLLQAQAYQMTDDGGFVSAPNGYPSRTSNTTHTVLATSLGSKAVPNTHTLTPGWVKHLPPNQTAVSVDNLPEGSVVAETLPVSASVGDLVFVEPYLYRWDEGIATATARSKVEELLMILANSAPLSGLGFR